MVFIVFFRGQPGVGKSTTARALAKKLNLSIVDYDDVKGELMTAVDGPTLPRIAYRIAENILRTNTAIGIDMVFDSHGYYRKAFDKCTRLVGWECVVLVSCHCSDAAEWHSRLRTRAVHARPSQVTDHRLLTKGTAQMEELGAAHEVILDTKDSVTVNVSRIVHFLDQLGFRQQQCETRSS